MAEVLITLAIIGVVAALTIPTLITEYKERELVTRAKKAYSEIVNAIDLGRAENGYGNNTVVFDTKNTNEESTQAFSKYFKVQAICKANKDGCGGKYLYKAGGPVSNNGETYDGYSISWHPRFQTMSDMIIAVEQKENCKRLVENVVRDENGIPVKDEDGNEVRVETLETFCAEVIVDTNGNKEPNQIGRDIFKIQITENSFDTPNTMWAGGLQNVIKTGKLFDAVDYEIGGSLPKEE